MKEARNHTVEYTCTHCIYDISVLRPSSDKTLNKDCLKTGVIPIFKQYFSPLSMAAGFSLCNQIDVQSNKLGSSFTLQDTKLFIFIKQKLLHVPLYVLSTAFSESFTLTTEIYIE